MAGRNLIPPKTRADSQVSTATLQAAAEGATTQPVEAGDVTVEAGTAGLAAGSVQEALQSLATRLAAVETP